MTTVRLDQLRGENANSRSSEDDGPVPPSRDDVELIRRLLLGDEAAFAGLVVRHHSAMVRVAWTLAPGAIAEEIAQETWQAVLERLATFESRSSLQTWIFRILVRRARTRGAREWRNVPVGDIENDDERSSAEQRSDPVIGRALVSALADHETPERMLLNGELRLALENAIAALPPTLRTVLVMRDVAGLDASEVCDALNLTETNQRVMLHRARLRVRARLVHHWREE